MLSAGFRFDFQSQSLSLKTKLGELSRDAITGLAWEEGSIGPPS